MSPIGTLVHILSTKIMRRYLLVLLCRYDITLEKSLEIKQTGQSQVQRNRVVTEFTKHITCPKLGYETFLKDTLLIKNLLRLNVYKTTSFLSDGTNHVCFLTPDKRTFYV